MKVMLLWRRYIRGFSCRYFFSRSCSIFTCPNVYWEHVEMGTTPTVRNSQLNPQQPEQMHDLHFGSLFN